MEQFEKVVKGLECWRYLYPKHCDACKYYTTDCTAGIAADALALIRQQQERIAELEAAQQWISVKDRLPEEDVDVIAYNCNYQQIAAYTTNPTKYWYTISGSTISPTHWMPLPEPPKEEEHAAD